MPRATPTKEMKAAAKHILGISSITITQLRLMPTLYQSLMSDDQKLDPDSIDYENDVHIVATNSIGIPLVFLVLPWYSRPWYFGPWYFPGPLPRISCTALSLTTITPSLASPLRSIATRGIQIQGWNAIAQHCLGPAPQASLATRSLKSS